MNFFLEIVFSINIFMKKGFKIVDLPGQQCRKVAGIKQQGHRTANLKRYETPDKNLTVRFFCNIISAFYTSQRSNKIFQPDLQLNPVITENGILSILNPTSFHLKLQKAAQNNLAGSFCLLGKSNIDIFKEHIKNDVPDRREMLSESAIKSKKQIKWLSI